MCETKIEKNGLCFFCKITWVLLTQIYWFLPESLIVVGDFSFFKDVAINGHKLSYSLNSYTPLQQCIKYSLLLSQWKLLAQNSLKSKEFCFKAFQMIGLIFCFSSSSEEGKISLLLQITSQEQLLARNVSEDFSCMRKKKI